MKLTKERRDFLLNSSRDERIYVCSKSFFLFACYYFNKYFTYKFADFHEDLFQDFEDLVYGRIPAGAWVVHRDGAKTSIAKIGLAWIIARKSVIDKLEEAGEDVSAWGVRNYINVDSYDKDNAEAILFDVVTELQTNEKIIGDFGNLYNQPRSKEQAQMKRISNFVTATGIRVEAHTALTPMRGRLYQQYRPDFVLRDDLENMITSISPVVTEKIISLIDEAKGGLASHGVSLNLGNYIIENGVVGYLMKSVEAAGGRVRFVPVVDKKGKVSWPDKYVRTDAEARILNAKITDPTLRKVSLESKKRELNVDGKRIYEVDFLLDPIAAGTTFFDRRIVQKAIDAATEYDEDLAGFHVWAKYNPSHAYAIGADTGKGNGGDSSTSVLFDYSTRPARQVGSYANNLIPADQFAHELKRQGNKYGTCLLAPEKNAESGGSCIATLKMIYDIEKIYRKIVPGTTKDKPTFELGWETNGATKYNILNDFKAAFEAGDVEILDIRILKEMRTFTYSDADLIGRARIGHLTKHFDLLMATAIAWEMRKHAKPAPKKNAEAYEQTKWESPSLDE